MVGRSVGDGRIGGGGFCCAKSVVGGPAYEWVPKDGSTVSGLTTIVGGCGGCGGSVGGGGCVLILVVFFSLFIYYFYKVVLVDVGLCRRWLSTLLQPRWLCRC